MTTSSATARRLQTNTVIRGVAFRLNYLHGPLMKVLEVNETANVFHGPFLASFVSGLRETSLSISTSHEVDDVFTYIIDRSHEVLAGSRRWYLTRSPLNITLRVIVGASLWAGGVDNVLCFDPSNGYHGVSLLGRGRRIVSLEFETIASHGGTDGVDQSPNLGVCSRWHEDCEVCTLCGSIAVGHQVDSVA